MDTQVNISYYNFCWFAQPGPQTYQQTVSWAWSGALLKNWHHSHVFVLIVQAKLYI